MLGFRVVGREIENVATVPPCFRGVIRCELPSYLVYTYGLSHGFGMRTGERAPRALRTGT